MVRATITCGLVCTIVMVAGCFFPTGSRPPAFPVSVEGGIVLAEGGTNGAH